MATTIKLVLRKNKRRADGTAPVYLRITAHRKTRFVASGIAIDPKYWNEKRQEVRRSHELSDAYNAKLQDLRHDAERLGLELGSAHRIKKQLRGEGAGSTISLTGFLSRFIDALDRQKRYWSWKRYRVVREKLQGCFGKHIEWDEIDHDALVRFERYMVETCENGPNTVRKELAMLHHVYRMAIKEGVIRADQDPFLRYDAPKPKSPERLKLSLQDVERLASADLKPGSWMAKARDAWLISFYLGGMRFGDLACLKRENFQNGHCTYRMNKTGRIVQVPVPDQARALLAPYMDGTAPEAFVLPFLKPGDDRDVGRLRRRISSNNALCNRFIKDAAKIAEIEEADRLTMHCSRHSFADFARQKSGNLYAISKTLGHSSLQITQTYLKSFDQEAVDRLADELWSER